MRISSRWFITVALLGSACGGGGQAQPPGDEETDTGAGGTDDDGSSSEGSSGEPTGGEATEGEPTGGDECVGPEGCFACPPTKPAELLNACTDATCAPFPNTVERLPLIGPDGKLPPLP